MDTRKIFPILTISLLLVASSVFGIPAKPGKIAYTQPDGTVVTIELRGDEYCHWAVDSEGRTVQIGEDGFLKEVSREELTGSIARGNRARAAARNTDAPRASVTTGSIRVPVILVEFSDRDFVISDPVTAFSNLLNQEGYSSGGATGSVRDFYSDNSNGAFIPVFDVYGPVKVSNTRSYYAGSNGTARAGEAFTEACRLLNSQIDFSQYDSDRNGYVDMVLFYYAGYNQAEGAANTIWPHESYLYAGPYDGKYIREYSCTSELKGTFGANMCGIGTACHELGHALGLPDMYDTNYEDDGQCEALYSFSTMCSGSYNNDGRTPPFFNIEERIFLGWNTPGDIEEITAGGTYSLPAVSPGVNKAYKTATTMNNEYFLYECRGGNTWDQYIGGAGLVVYHVDKSERTVIIDSRNVKASQLWSNWGAYNGINKNGSHPCFYVIPAADQTNLNYGGSANRMVFPGSSRVTTFNGVDWNGSKSNLDFFDISYSTATKTATFKVEISGMEDKGFNYIYNPGRGSYPVGTQFPLVLVETESEAPSSVAWYFDGNATTAEKVALTAGEHTVVAELTYSDGATGRIKLVLKAK